MYEQVEKPKENKSRAVANSFTQKKSDGKQDFGFVDNRPEAVAQRKLQELGNKGAELQVVSAQYIIQPKRPIQKKECDTVLPDSLKVETDHENNDTVLEDKMETVGMKPLQMFSFEKCAKNLGTSTSKFLVQRVRYPLKEIPPTNLHWSEIKVEGYTVPKRMIARPLTYKKGGGRKTEHSTLWEALKKAHGKAIYYDAHLLNHDLGGSDTGLNMVPVTPDANSQMSERMEEYVKSLIRPSQSDAGVVDYEVTANYGRGDRRIPAENAIPTSLDMRVIPQGKNLTGWDDEDTPKVLNVRVDLPPLGTVDPNEIVAPNLGNERKISPPFHRPVGLKNELIRQLSSISVLTIPEANFTKYHGSKGDILTGELQDDLWTQRLEVAADMREDVRDSANDIQYLGLEDKVMSTYAREVTTEILTRGLHSDELDFADFEERMYLTHRLVKERVAEIVVREEGVRRKKGERDIEDAVQYVLNPYGDPLELLRGAINSWVDL